ncbi:MAG: B12-binding domain-containing protein [Pirellulaceae bacterium]
MANYRSFGAINRGNSRAGDPLQNVGQEERQELLSYGWRGEGAMSNFSTWNGHVRCDVQSRVSSGAGRHQDRTSATDGGETRRRTEHRISVLAKTIENEIIPRLLIAHTRLTRAEILDARDDLTTSVDDVDQLSSIVLEGDSVLACAYVADLRERGVALEHLFLELLAPTARHLGKLWESDHCSFADVTIGLGVLQLVLRELGPVFEHELDAPPLERRLLLIPANSERHTFGLSMVEEFFRRAGWDVLGGPTLDCGAQLKILKREDIDVVGFSINGETCLDRLVSDIRDVRQASRNRQVVVMVGGSLINSQPELVALVGADATAADGREAVTRAGELVDELSTAIGEEKK